MRVNSENGSGVVHKSGTHGSKDRYAVALAAALTILEEVDNLPPSNRPVRLAKVIGIVLDAIYEGAIDNSTVS